MTEIGSEFWVGCTPLDGTGVAELLPAGMDAHYALCGRTALELLLRDAMQERTIRKAYLPSYCCHTMIEPFVAKGIQVVFYDVFFTDTGIEMDFDREHTCDLVFLMDYFGFINEGTTAIAQSQKANGKLVIYDATHSLFCENVDYSHYDYVFGSFRKWFGVNAGFCAKRDSWTGFPVLVQNVAYSEKRNAAFTDKRQFMAGAPVDKQRFLNAFSQAEKSLETDYVGYGPDAQSLEILKTVNVEYIRQKRRENAAFAIEKINQMASLGVHSPYRQVRDGDCPLFVPLAVVPQIRADLRQWLIENRVYLPIHWPLSDLHRTSPRSDEIYNKELSLVCDQRYSLEDMKRAITIMRSV
ncbi:MAG: hypothetical protein J6Q92_06000 [Oscillospiraceae bacterium]|nr:hypothetical protein [Oscillospiraceae bacterium]